MIDLPKVLLASGSPRRHELLGKMDIKFEVKVPDVEEIIPEDINPKDAPEYLARLKAKAAKDQFRTTDLILTADTIVLHNDKILGKPKTIDEARDSLTYLSGTRHSVITGVCFMLAEHIKSFSCETWVQFKNIDPNQIEYYISNYQVLDKAGSYGIQDWIGATHIEFIQGSYTNIMGLPTTMTYHELLNFIQK